ncbi:MAG TPA: rod shape-determining protein RodA, partial [Candidatus Limnocylindria bacterium]|nr:rod shape-determining protein RodA [Candidatus Limnocylindria bacterium]
TAMRIERAQLSTLGAKPESGSWRAFDIQLAVAALALAVIGLLMAWTNSPDGPLSAGSIFTRGLMWFAISIIAFASVAAFDYRWLRTFVVPIYFVNIGLLILTLIIGITINGAQRWLSIGGLTFQISEISKVVMVGVLATFLEARKDKLGNLSTLIGAGMLIAPPFVLVMIQPDLGSALVVVAIAAGALFLSGASMRWMGLAAGSVVAAVPVIWSILQDYQRRRLLSFLDPASDPQGAGFQVIQAQIAVGSGGMFGKGLTNGSQGASNLLPVEATDFAFAVLLEELGFFGGILVFVLFMWLIWRVLLVGWRSGSVFGIAFAGGTTAMIIFQILVNAGMIAGIMPVTGIPLPFITHGGASLVSTAIALGLIQSIAMRSDQPRPSW